MYSLISMMNFSFLEVYLLGDQVSVEAWHSFLKSGIALPI